MAGSVSAAWRKALRAPLAAQVGDRLVVDLFLAFIALSRVPTTDVKMLAPALGPANWWTPRRPGNAMNERPREQPGKSSGPAPATRTPRPQ